MQQLRIVCRLSPIKPRNSSNENVAVYEKHISVFTKYKTFNNSEGRIEHKFPFDHILSSSSTQETVFNIVGAPIGESLLEGGDWILLVYGETSTGKTYTMFGESTPSERQGLIPRIANQIHNKIQSLGTTLFLSAVEIYNNELTDMLSPKAVISILSGKNGPCVNGLTEHKISSKGDIYKCINIVNKVRHTKKTWMNESSSRSHAAVIFSLRNREHLFARLLMIDLAGSEPVDKIEPVGKFGLSGKSFNSQNINTSLFALRMMFRRFTNPTRSFTPCRDSNLTRLLESYVTSKSQIGLIVTINLSSSNTQGTLSSCEFSANMRNIHMQSIDKLARPHPREFEFGVKGLQNRLDELQKMVYTHEKLLTKNQSRHEKEICVYTEKKTRHNGNSFCCSVSDK